MKEKIGFIVSERYLKEKFPNNLIEFCKSQGHEIEIIIPERIKHIDSSKLDCSFYFHRNHDKVGLDLLKTLEKKACVFNSYRSVMNCQNKLIINANLSKTDILIPKTYLDISEVKYPVIIKKVNGNNGEGIIKINSSYELENIKSYEFNYIIQQYIPNRGYDIKLYCINKKVYAVKKQSPIHKYKMIKPELIECTKEMTDIALKCGELFNLNVFGVDTIIDHKGKLYVIEVNECSSFSKVPNIEKELYKYMLNCLYNFNTLEEVSM